MKKLLLFLLIPIGAFGQALSYVPPSIGLFYSSDGSGASGTWDPLTGSGGSNPLTYVPPTMGMYYSNDGTGNINTWVPCSSSCIGGGGGGSISLTTTGTSGAATLTGTVLNIPVYSSGSAPAFSAITSGTNTAAAMVVGTGASLAATGTGAITATAAPLAGITGFGTGVATILAATPTGTGSLVAATNPTLVTPVLGAATATSVLFGTSNGVGWNSDTFLSRGIAGIVQVGTSASNASGGISLATVNASSNIKAGGTVDGLAPTTVTTGATATVGGGTFVSGYTVNENATAATAITYTLPVAAAGKQYCVENGWNGSAATTGVITLATSATGQFIIFTDGTLSATGGNVTSGGAGADMACVHGIDATHWQLSVIRGTWTKH